MSCIAERIAADQSKFLSDFGASASYTSASSTWNVTGIFNAAHEIIADGVMTTGPVFICEASDSIGAIDDWITINSVEYFVTRAEPSGDGMTTLHLSQAEVHG